MVDRLMLVAVPASSLYVNIPVAGTKLILVKVSMADCMADKGTESVPPPSVISKFPAFIWKAVLYSLLLLKSPVLFMVVPTMLIPIPAT